MTTSAATTARRQRNRLHQEILDILVEHGAQDPDVAAKAIARVCQRSEREREALVAQMQRNPRLAKIWAHPLRVPIMRILSEDEASPNEIAKQLGESVGVVSYHIRVLHDHQLIKLLRVMPKRGAVEHFYKAVERLPL